MPSYVRAKFSRVTISYRILPILDLVWASIALTSNCLLSATTWKFLRRCFLMFLLTFLLHPLLQPVLSLVIVDVSVSICFASLSEYIYSCTDDTILQRSPPFLYGLRSSTWVQSVISVSLSGIFTFQRCLDSDRHLKEPRSHLDILLLLLLLLSLLLLLLTTLQLYINYCDIAVSFVAESR